MKQEEINYRGKVIEIHTDDDAECPEDWETNDAFHVFEHRQHHVDHVFYKPRKDQQGTTDKLTAKEVYDWLQENPKKKLFPYTYKTYDGKYKDAKYWVFKCYAYIHSGVALSVGSAAGFPDQRWDVSSTGFFLVQRDKGTYTVEAAKKVAEGICSSWNMYLSGEVYGYKTVDKEGGDAGYSCWGYYGEESKKEMISEAKAEIDSDIRKNYSFVGKRYTTWQDETKGIGGLPGIFTFGVHDTTLDHVLTSKKKYGVSKSKEEAIDLAIELNEKNADEDAAVK